MLIYCLENSKYWQYQYRGYATQYDTNIEAMRINTRAYPVRTHIATEHFGTGVRAARPQKLIGQGARTMYQLVGKNCASYSVAKN